MKRRCGACGFPTRKTVRALVITSNEPPRMGLVCKACANCGTLVVCGTLRILPPKPKKVPRSALAKHIREALTCTCETEFPAHCGPECDCPVHHPKGTS